MKVTVIFLNVLFYGGNE